MRRENLAPLGVGSCSRGDRFWWGAPVRPGGGDLFVRWRVRASLCGVAGVGRWSLPE